MCDAIERAVLLRLRKQQSDARQRQEERHREAADDVVQRHAANVHADNPRKGKREDADVQLRKATHEDGDDERSERDVGEIHSTGAISS